MKHSKFIYLLEEIISCVSDAFKIEIIRKNGGYISHHDHKFYNSQKNVKTVWKERHEFL